MKPVLVLQHMIDDGPAYLATWLAGQGVAMDVRCTQGGDAYPPDMGGHGALAVLGGPMSANDPLPSLRQAESLIREAMARDLPVIGHCLGGQLMARALGAAVAASPLPEVGWHAVQWQAGAAQWFGEANISALACEVFEWHFEAFELPPGAHRLAGNANCPNQAFAIGPHLAMQFHVELDAAKFARWCTALDEDYLNARARHPGEVQDVPAMQHDLERRLAAQQRLAATAYQQWIGQARR